MAQIPIVAIFLNDENQHFEVEFPANVPILPSELAVVLHQLANGIAVNECRPCDIQCHGGRKPNGKPGHLFESPAHAMMDEFRRNGNSEKT